MGMSRHAPTITLDAEQRRTLESWTRAATAEQRMVLRARIILAAAEGVASCAIARELGTTALTVAKWRRRFADAGLAGLRDAPRTGRPPKYGPETERRILVQLDEKPPEGHVTWTGPLLAAALGDVTDDEVWRVLRKHRISLVDRHSWCVSTDPEFGAKAAAIVEVYLDPPENAVVLCVDEKPNIQALERDQGWLRGEDGRAITGYAHEYRRHGTTNLFAALDVATGIVQGKHYKRKRRVEFLDFMNTAIAPYPEGTEIHVVLDNLSTHKPKNDQWLRRHKNVHFHYTPTHASWLNQVEIWFSILWRRALRGASFRSPKELAQAIGRFIATYNQTAHPFAWTARNVAPKGLVRSYAELRK